MKRAGALISILALALAAGACRTTGAPGASGSATPTVAPTVAPTVVPTVPGPLVPRWGAIPSPAPGTHTGTAGAVVWRTRVPARQSDYPSQVVVSPDGTTVYALEATGGGPWADSVQRHARFTVMALRATDGAVLWQAHLGRPHADSRPAAMAISPDGREIFVTGAGALRAGSPDGSRFLTAALRAGDGHRLWAAQYGPNGSGPTAIAVDPVLARIYVAGSSQEARPNADFLTVAYRATDGRRLWAAGYDGTAGREDEARSLAVDPRGTWVAVTGWSEGPGHATQTATALYAAADGTRRWVARQPGTAGPYGSVTQGTVGASTNGRMVFALGRDLVAHRASNGSEVWTSPAPPRAGALAVNPNGRQVLVTGYAPGPQGHGAPVTLGYRAPNGAIQWRTQFGDPAPGGTFPTGISVSPDGRAVHVIAWDFKILGNPGVAQWLTLAYGTSNGRSLWSASYLPSDLQTAFASAVAVSPDGTTVYVFGKGLTDMTTPRGSLAELIAYRA